VLIHFAGINTIIDYAPVILQSAGFTLDTALLATIGIGFANFLFTAISFWTIDLYGRRPLYIVGSLGMGAALCGMVLAAELGLFSGMSVLILIIVYLLFFCSCIGPVFWTILPELFQNEVRGVAMVYPVLMQWLANAIVVLVFPSAFESVGKSWTFGFLALTCLTQAWFAWRFLPETRDVSLEELNTNNT
jgi:MFS transporter, SP family, arabinose:H+ symporter